MESRRPIVGRALLAAGAVMAVLAVLAFTGTLPIPRDMRLVVGLVLGAAAVTDVFMGLRFLQE